MKAPRRRKRRAWQTRKASLSRGGGWKSRRYEGTKERIKIKTEETKSEESEEQCGPVESEEARCRGRRNGRTQDGSGGERVSGFWGPRATGKKRKMRDSASGRSFLGSGPGLGLSFALACLGPGQPGGGGNTAPTGVCTATTTEAAEQQCTVLCVSPKGWAVELGAQEGGAEAVGKKKGTRKKKRERKRREKGREKSKRSRPWRCLQSRAGRGKERANRCGVSFVSHMTTRHKRASSSFRPKKAAERQEPDSKI